MLNEGCAAPKAGAVEKPEADEVESAVCEPEPNTKGAVDMAGCDEAVSADEFPN